MIEIKRKATLTKDATLFEDSVQLNYKRRGFPSAFSGPSKDKCPPMETLKKDTRVLITFDQWSYGSGRIIKVELA